MWELAGLYSLYSLEKLIEWKLEGILQFYRGDNKDPLLAREIN